MLTVCTLPSEQLATDRACNMMCAHCKEDNMRPHMHTLQCTQSGMQGRQLHTTSLAYLEDQRQVLNVAGAQRRMRHVHVRFHIPPQDSQQMVPQLCR